ncbi:class I SAM-dependent methyltransferase family protein [Utexia brackfieldae]|uniref:class I SAM-dependent methyltransferase family protein n=1 Tax=Utexia brackfieldae TaxID=3074108 RepID=UPI00370D9C8E
MTCFDGTPLHYQYWSADEGSQPHPAIVLLRHAGQPEHYMGGLVADLRLPCHQIFSLCLRTSVSATNQACLHPAVWVRDIDEFVTQIKLIYQIPLHQMIIVGEDIAALVIAAWLHDYAPQLKAAILVNPLLRFPHWWQSGGDAKGYPQPHDLCRSALIRPRQRLLAGGKGSPSTILSRESREQLSEMVRRIRFDAAAIYMPIVMLINEQASSSVLKAQYDFFNQLGSRYKRINRFSSQRLKINRQLLTDRIRLVIDELMPTHSTLPLLFDADQHGITKQEFDQLVAPERHWLKRLQWRLSRALLKHVGVFSTGIQIGLTHGFDSGLSLDYIYQNRPTGCHWLGKRLDKIYLNHRSWQSVRQRKVHLEALLLIAITYLQANHQPVKILDIAAGNGHYLLDFIKQHRCHIDHVLLRDFVTANVQQGLSTLEAQQLSSQVSFEWGDAFDETSLAALPQDRTIAIASGFYELFDNNVQVIRSLKGVAQALAVGGFFIVTTKIWNPNLEFMARVLSSHKDGQAWTLRRRHQLEIDQLLAIAGFHKVAQRIDEWGIFTVTLVQKVSRHL